jgi:hypothetical protein
VSEQPSSESRSRLFAKVDAELQAGRVWRAKEILRGSLRQYATDSTVLARYAEVLDQLGDRLEAGKFYFLSGMRGGAADVAIRVFLERHGGGHLHDLLAQFPQASRRAGLNAFPEVVRDDLAKLGLPEKSIRRNELAATPRRPRFVNYFVGVGCTVIGALLVAALFLGLGTISKLLLGS